MKLTEQQALMLFLITWNSISFHDNMGYSRDIRKKLIDEIVGQQDNETQVEIGRLQKTRRF